MNTYDPLSIAKEIRDQLSSDKRRLFFFLGAGTSMAAGLPGIVALTDGVEKSLTGDLQKQFQDIRKELGKGAHVEQILDRIRLYRELIGSSEEAVASVLKGASTAKKLDVEICRAISAIVRADPSNGLSAHTTFAQWLRALHSSRDYPVEIYTTNYDLLVERALEEMSVPFFDGFIGSVNPFFSLESVEADALTGMPRAAPPRSWTRVWKVHGSVNWRMHRLPQQQVERITRVQGDSMPAGEELAVFPSRDKYSESRRLPFLALQDRFRRLLTGGEALLVIAGYSFADQHLNEIIFQSLRSNPKLAALSLTFGDWVEKGGEKVLAVGDDLVQRARENRNLMVVGPDIASVGGVVGAWNLAGRKPKEGEEWPFWDEASNAWTLGDFKKFARYLEAFAGFGAFGRPKAEGNGAASVVTDASK